MQTNEAAVLDSDAVVESALAAEQESANDASDARSEAEISHVGETEAARQASGETEAARQASGDTDVAVDRSPASERRRLEEQLDALKRREAELRRALALADHPALADAVRLLEGRAYAITRVDAKLAQGLSKSEERRVETVEKKLSAARSKREELDVQIAELERERAQLGVERTESFRTERRDAMIQLIAELNAHDDAFRGAGVEVATMLPQIGEWMPEIRALAAELASRRFAPQA